MKLHRHEDVTLIDGDNEREAGVPKVMASLDLPRLSRNSDGPSKLQVLVVESDRALNKGIPVTGRS